MVIATWGRWGIEEARSQSTAGAITAERSGK
jgi:hypothetical protein